MSRTSTGHQTGPSTARLWQRRAPTPGLTWMLVAPWGEREGPPVLAAGPVDVPWDDVLAALERIEARLEMPSPSGLPSRDESGRAPASQPMVEEDLRAMATALDELRLAVEANMSGGAGRIAGANSLQELKDKNVRIRRGE